MSEWIGNRRMIKKWEVNRKKGKEIRIGVREKDIWLNYVKNLVEG